MQPDETGADTGPRGQHSRGQSPRNRSVANPRRIRLAAREQAGETVPDATSAAPGPHAA